MEFVNEGKVCQKVSIPKHRVNFDSLSVVLNCAHKSKIYSVLTLSLKNVIRSFTQVFIIFLTTKNLLLYNFIETKNLYKSFFDVVKYEKYVLHESKVIL